MDSLHLTAIGSSFAAGPGVLPELDPASRTSGNNYAHVLQRSLGPNCKLHDASSSGATLLNVLSEPQEIPLQRTSLPPQIDGIPAESKIVTLTAGGNDMGYTRDMIVDAAEAAIKDPEYLGALKQMLGLAADGPRDATAEEVKERFVRVVDAVREKCGEGVRIYLVEYVNVFGPESVGANDQPIGEQRVRFHVRRAKELSKAYRDAAAARPDGVEVVRMSEISEGHELGSAEPWVIGFTPQMLQQGLAPLHPNAAGHAAVARELEKRITGSG